jgi:hypothetical protein
MARNRQRLTTTRFERKYRCNYHQYYAIKNALYPYIQQDPYTIKAPQHKYLVRSLYFDTPGYQIYFEKLGGNSDRIKYRIRTYSDSIERNPDVRVEMKLRQANLTMKYGTYISIANCQDFLKTRHWETQDDPVLHEFERQTHLMNLVPKTLVEYHREGFQTKDGKGIRITFDHRIKSAHAKLLFPEQVFWQGHPEQMVVLEIKHQGEIPRWLNQVIKTNGLGLVANSKFAFGIQASQPDLIWPGWSDS